jgi:enamine deaminase RidA (YjgF/YER057c/UK114 family)
VTRVTRVNVSSGSPFERRVGYSRAVRVGSLVVVAGTTAPGDGLDAQTREVFRRIESALVEAGVTLSDVVRTRMYLTDISQWEVMADVHSEVFGDIRPVATVVEVSALISPELLIEVEVDAYVSND